MKDELAKGEQGLRDEVFTQQEIDYCTGKRYPERHFAARFAAKEALFKALSTGKTPTLGWREIEVCNDAPGRPYFTFSGAVKVRLEELAVCNASVSLTHTGQYGLATVILES